jgi:hypothetical protein
MLEEMTLGYEEALAEEDPDFRSRRPDCVRVVMRQAVGRTWENLARERIADVRPTIPLGKRFWPLNTEERAEIERIFATEEVRRLVTALRSRKNAIDTVRITLCSQPYNSSRIFATHTSGNYSRWVVSPPVASRVAAGDALDDII